MQLNDLLAVPLPESDNCSLTGLAIDSRVVRPGDVFCALAGTQTHGRIYIDTALKRGAIAIFQEGDTDNVELLADNVPCITIPHLSQRVGEMAARFYDYPSRDLQVIGVTGTNGKTSTTHFIAQVLHTQAPCGLLGTLGYGLYGALQPSHHTTPDAIQLQAFFAKFRAQGAQYAIMEVSSHALVQGRVNGTQFDTAVFTNLTRDHLDYHQTMSAYAAAKKQLFLMPGVKTAVINLDDAFGQELLQQLPKTVVAITYSLQDSTADVQARVLHSNPQGCQLALHTRWGNSQLHSPLFGRFNVSNLLAALTVLLNMGLPLADAVEKLGTIHAVPGRMEHFGQPQQPSVIVDYAHTPDALEKVLLALRTHCTGTLWCIFGCGGNRDRGKRPLMGAITQRHADKIVITDDNPRRETSKAIIDDILQGCPQPTAVIPDREQAIRYALQQAKMGDIVLIAGKGHEDYQEIGDQRYPFSDRTLVATLLQTI